MFGSVFGSVLLLFSSCLFRTQAAFPFYDENGKAAALSAHVSKTAEGRLAADRAAAFQFTLNRPIPVSENKSCIIDFTAAVPGAAQTAVQFAPQSAPFTVCLNDGSKDGETWEMPVAAAAFGGAGGGGKPF